MIIAADFRILIRRSAVLPMLFLFLISFTSATPVSAAVNWQTNTLREVYNPSGNFYTYAPTVVVDGGTEHIYTCHNRDDGVVKDSIYYTRVVNGVVQESREVLTPGAPGTWDNFHVCDPVIVGGQFNYSGVTYSYAMLYLGNDVNASAHNQIGVAFANDLAASSWVRYPNPIIPFPANVDPSYWGVGQQTATSVDGNGRMLVMYKQDDSGGTRGYVRDINLNNMSSPVIGAPVQITNAGLLGPINFMSNFDMVYDPTRDRFYAITDKEFATSAPTYVSTAMQIVSLPGGDMWGGTGSWTVEGVLDSSVTGFVRNHNGSIKRTVWGSLPNPASIDILFGDSCAQPDCGGFAIPEWSYDLWEIRGSLNATVTVDDRTLGSGQNQFSYAGSGWGYNNNSGYYASTHSYSNTLNDSVTIAFTGTQIRLYGGVGSGAGIAGVSIDNGTEVYVDFYASADAGDRLLWTSLTLPAGQHTLRLRVTGMKHASAVNTYIVPDRVDIIP